jgi:hypothetical protein
MQGLAWRATGAIAGRAATANSGPRSQRDKDKAEDEGLPIVFQKRSWRPFLLKQTVICPKVFCPDWAYATEVRPLLGYGLGIRV